ncbi:MAG: AraC family transcriptional regulator [Bacteroides sp.]|nr:AraC family transcriptional regulator [Bacteroides sp.]
MKADANVRYLSASDQDLRWWLTVNTVGHQRIKPHAPYPSSNHPFIYIFSPEKGRILSDEYQLIYILEGQGTFKSTHKKAARIKSGQMILLFPGEWHSYQPDKETGWYEHWIGFSGPSIDPLIKERFFTRENPVFDVGMNEEIIKLYKQAAVISQEQSAGFQQMLAGIVHLLLGYTYAGNKQASFVNMRVACKIDKAKKIIIENYNNSLSPEEVAARVHISYSWFRKLFRHYTGFSPSQFKEELRIQKSKELLANTDLSSQEIAFEVGFNTPYHFCILFKRKTDYAPLAFRKLVR